MKQKHPAIKLVDDCIKWFSKPGRYVKDGTEMYERNEKGDICRTCLLGTVNLFSDNLTNSRAAAYLVKDCLDDTAHKSGFYKHYTSSQAQAIFKKTKRLLVKTLKEKGEI